mgnify:CR=1 FL=1
MAFAWRNEGRRVARREWAAAKLVGAESPGAPHSGACGLCDADSRDSWDLGGKCDVIGNISSTAWYAAVRGLPCCQDLSDRILIHHSTLSQSRNGCSMPLAKCILSQNVRRVRVCKRHLLPARDRKAPDAAGESSSWRVFRFCIIFHFLCLIRCRRFHFAAPL